MRRTALCGVAIVAVLLAVTACGGSKTPTKPTETTPATTSPPSPTPPADPAPTPSPAPAPTAVTLSGTITESGTPIAGATILVEDGPDARRKTTSDTGGRYVLADLQPGSITLKVERDGYDNTYVKVTLSGDAVAQNVTMSKATPQPAPRPGSAGIVFLSSSPSPGSEAVMTEDLGGFAYLRDLKMQFAVQYPTALPDAKLEVDLFNDAGQLCAYSYTDHAIPANQTETVSLPVVWVWEWANPACGPFPFATASVKATLLTLREPLVNGRLQRTDYVTQSFPLRYTVRRYPLPPAGAPAAAPSISDLSWRVMLPVGGAPPIPGDPVTIGCTARETDGAAMTITITVTWDGRTPATYTQGFPEGASSSPSGARTAIGVGAPSPATAKIDCLATNSRGETARKSTTIGR